PAKAPEDWRSPRRVVCSAGFGQGAAFGVRQSSGALGVPMNLPSAQHALELRALAHEPHRVLVNQLIHCFGAVSAFAHFQSGPRDRQWDADSPIAGAVHPDALLAVEVDDIDGP